MIAVKGQDVLDMFCTAIEIILSAEMNKESAKIMLEAIPTDILRKVNDGLIVLASLVNAVIKERKAKEQYEQLRQSDTI